MSRVFFPHQTEALNALYASLRNGKRRPMMMLPTGAGKTVLASEIVKRALAKDKRVTFVVPSIELVSQAIASFEEHGISADLIGALQGSNHRRFNPAAPVQVGTVQTIARRTIQPCDVVVVDEAHVVFDAMRKWIGSEEYARVPFIGLSATPWSSGLGLLYDDLIQTTSTQALIDAGRLSPFRVFAPGERPDLTGVRTVAGDYHKGDLEKAVNKPKLVADIVETWLERGEGRPTFIFGVDRAHARSIQAEFERVGIMPCGYVDGFTDSGERADLFRRFRSGEMKVISSVGCLTTGIDADVRCLVLARPTKSAMLYTQIIGRGLRTAADHPVYGPKLDCLILDHTDTTARLGFVTDIHVPRLDDGAPNKAGIRKIQAKEEALPKVCPSPSCSFLKPAKVHACPSCGFEPAKPTTIVCEDGSLVEVTQADAARAKAQAKADLAEQRSILGQLQSYAASHGNKSGWVGHKYKAWFGDWPNAHRNVPDVEPSPRVLSWLRAQNIRWAKGSGKARGFRAPTSPATVSGGRNAEAR
ncbi:DEAD/DEAH box helicase [Methylobacterium sp. SD274]|uniref:DEAD/DEAH box helicase n=1 Tax=Methylobacterium sp. SD274 TaxID=2782009 RepID=UPI001A962E50|nr:DEAD/DEAH box helicase [Methylobacterium sp. SD274]MBO1022595.1 DEAD/DEAH box helicase [Methylobacterium sp. SD274]